MAFGAAWLGSSVLQVKADLEASTRIIPQLKGQLLAGDSEAVQASLASLQTHTAAARETSEGPLWRAAEYLPWAGSNFSAVAAVAGSVDHVVENSAPLLDGLDLASLGGLVPADGRMDIEALEELAPALRSAATAVKTSYGRVAAIDRSELLPQLADPLAQATEAFAELQGPLDAAASAAGLLPPLLGADGERSYLVLIQNSAEVRATGGIPGALAVIEARDGAIELADQGSASALGVFDPSLEVDPAQELIYTERLGTYMQDVNLTPDFPTAAATAKAMWEQKHPGSTIDGVVAVDTVVLANLLAATGPVDLSSTAAMPAGTGALPTQLTSGNVVPTLLSDVYAEIEDPKVQDEYFSAVAAQIFAALAEGSADGRKLVEALQASTDENRLLAWSAHREEQDALADTRLAGAVTGPSAETAFGVYFNDGTGAKMDYYVERTAHLQRRCAADGTPTDTVEVTLTNKAPRNAAQSLPAYVTGAGAFGVDEGNIRTNVMIYGPAESVIAGARIDGKETTFGSLPHGKRPVGTLTLLLTPGESTTVALEFLASPVRPPVLDVTPTLQPLTEVVKPATIDDNCVTTG